MSKVTLRQLCESASGQPLKYLPELRRASMADPRLALLLCARGGTLTDDPFEGADLAHHLAAWAAEAYGAESFEHYVASICWVTAAAHRHVEATRRGMSPPGLETLMEAVAVVRTEHDDDEGALALVRPLLARMEDAVAAVAGVAS